MIIREFTENNINEITALMKSLCEINKQEFDVRFMERRLGKGEEFIRNIIKYSKSNHIHSIRLAIRPDIDDIAKKLFIKLGFENVLHIYELQI